MAPLGNGGMHEEGEEELDAAGLAGRGRGSARALGSRARRESFCSSSSIWCTSSSCTSRLLGSSLWPPDLFLRASSTASARLRSSARAGGLLLPRFI